MPTQVTSTGVVFPDASTQTTAIGGSLGYSQTYQNVTSSRALATNYTNSTGKTIYVKCACSLSGNAVTNITVNGVTWTAQTYSAAYSCTWSVWFAVQNGQTYQIAKGGGTTMVISDWWELR